MFLGSKAMTNKAILEKIIIKNPHFFCGQSPAKQELTTKKLRIVHAIFNAAMKTFNLFAHNLGIINNKKEIPAKKIFISAGLPKFVPSVCIPVIVLLIDSIYTQGTKENMIINKQDSIPND